MKKIVLLAAHMFGKREEKEKRGHNVVRMGIEWGIACKLDRGNT